MVDVSMLIKQAVDTGEVWIGSNRVERAVKDKSAKLVVIASNCPEFPWLKKTKVKVHKFSGTSVDLGVACGKPFSISAIAILNPGESSILSM